MSGICGIAKTDNENPVNSSIIAAMYETLAQ